jgi:hypothetical protein
MKFDKDMRAGIAANEIYIPKKYAHLAHEYPNITWAQANEFWKSAVKNIKTVYKVDYLIDIPFGKGYVEAFAEFKRMLEKANRQAEIERKGIEAMRETFQIVMNQLEEMGL